MNSTRAHAIAEAIAHTVAGILWCAAEIVSVASQEIAWRLRGDEERD